MRQSEKPEDNQKVEQANLATNLLRQRIAEYASGVVTQTPASSQSKKGGFNTVAREAVAKELEGRPIKDADEYKQVKRYQHAAHQRSRDLAREESAAERDREAAQSEFFKQKLKEFQAMEKAKAAKGKDKA